MCTLRAIHKIDLADREDLFLVSDYQPQDKLYLTLLDVNKCEAYSGSATDIELRSHAANIRMAFSTFVDLTTKAFTRNEFDGLQFLYCLEKNCEEFVFKWKSMDNDETTITIGIVKMFKNEYQSSIKDVLGLLSKELLSLNKKVTDIQADLIDSHNQKQEAMHLLAEATIVKERVENELYSKFILVLNEKKRKIRELYNNNSNKVSKKAKISNPKPNAVPRNRLHQISESDSDEVDDNLEDISVPGPSKAKRDASLLFYDDDEPKVSLSPSKVRNRKVASTNKMKDLPERVQATFSKICDSDNTESDDDLLAKL